MDQLLLDISISKNDGADANEQIVKGKKSIRYANKDQIEFTVARLDDLIPKDHRVRDVWAYTSQLDLSCFHEDIKILEGCPGPPKADPQILLTLWLYATLEGITSGRQLARLCQEHHAYICLVKVGPQPLLSVIF